MRDDLVMVHGVARVGIRPVEPELGRAAAGILAAVVDRFALVGGEGVIRFRLVKRRSPVLTVTA